MTRREATLAAISLAVAAATAQAEPRCAENAADGSCALYEVSMIELIATPEKLDGKMVRVRGFLNLEFEGNGLYLHEEDFRRSLDQNGIWVSVPRGTQTLHGCRNRSYVSMLGRFNARNRGHMGAWSGSIESISSCISLRDATNPSSTMPHAR